MLEAPNKCAAKGAEMDVGFGISCNQVFCGDCNKATHNLYMLPCRQNEFEFWRPSEANPPCKKIGKRVKTTRWPYAWYKQTLACIKESPHNEIGQMFSEDEWSHWNNVLTYGQAAANCTIEFSDVQMATNASGQE